MRDFLAVANRNGGVGKSTISVMLAHAFAVWGGKCVLLSFGDIEKDNGDSVAIDLLPGSLQFEDMQDELISHHSRHNTTSQHFRRALHFCRSAGRSHRLGPRTGDF